MSGVSLACGNSGKSLMKVESLHTGTMVVIKYGDAHFSIRYYEALTGSKTTASTITTRTSRRQ